MMMMMIIASYCGVWNGKKKKNKIYSIWNFLLYTTTRIFKNPQNSKILGP
jgi:hypothetical protein